MSYTFTIGKARLNDDHGYYGCGRWIVDECEGPPPHTDEWEASPHEGSPVRLPGYRLWHKVMEALPCFRMLFDQLRQMAQENRWNVIPVTAYVRDLPPVEAEAAGASPEHAARSQWFTRWSRHALSLYGEAAAFQTPGEWIDWPNECQCEEEVYA